MRPPQRVVAIEGDVERPGGDLRFFELPDQGRDPVRQRRSLPDDPDQHQAGGAAIPLDDFVGNASERAADLVRVHHPHPFRLPFGHQKSPLPRRADKELQLAGLACRARRPGALCSDRARL
jgi:hypothetical protein